MTTAADLDGLLAVVVVESRRDGIATPTATAACTWLAIRGFKTSRKRVARAMRALLEAHREAVFAVRQTAFPFARGPQS